VSTAGIDLERTDRQAPAVSFVVFVEGPRDGDVLRSWARSLSPILARRLNANTVILGGRQPARAVAHLKRLSEDGRPARGLCVLDRDHEVASGRRGAPVLADDGVNLELFVWRRRHIEAYLLEPDVVRRGLRITDRGLARRLQDTLELHRDELESGRIDAKRLLDRNGPIARLVGRRVDPGRIARATREEELHPEVRDLLGRIARGLDVRLQQTIVRATIAR